MKDTAAGGIHATQGTFSSLICLLNFIKLHTNFVYIYIYIAANLDLNHRSPAFGADMLTIVQNRKAMNRNWSNQKANPALKTKAGNKEILQIDKIQ